MIIDPDAPIETSSPASAASLGTPGMVQNLPPISWVPPQLGAPNVIIPQPFSFKRHSQSDKDKLVSEILDKVHFWETSSTQFFQEYAEFANSWRVQPRQFVTRRPDRLFNSKTGETHRATETLATLWFRMLTASDKYFEVVGEGLDDFGNQLDQNMLYATEAVLVKQLRTLQFKKKLLNSLRSLALFGTVIFEEPWVSLPYGGVSKYFEGTDFQHRSLIQTGYDTTAFDIDMSDFIFTCDYPTTWRMRNLATIDPETWDSEEIQSQIDKQKGSNIYRRSATTVYSRIRERKQRAGYNMSAEDNVMELINYHGRLDIDNPIVQDIWQSSGQEGDPNLSDFTIGVLNGESPVKGHVTQGKSWHNRFKVGCYKTFELEPLAYGVGKLGKKPQREMDTRISRAHDIVQMALYSMWIVSKYAGLKSNQLNIKPFNIVEVEDVSQLQKIVPDLEAVQQALAIHALSVEDFRALTGATANLQAVNTKATATEASLTQSEAIRGGSVHAEIISETLIRQHLETMHVNNLDYLDQEIWVKVSGELPPQRMNKMNLPKNIGFEIKTTTDKDFRPERIQNILQAIQIITSIRQVVPASINAIAPLFEEYFRSLGMNPRLLRQPIPIQDQILQFMQRAQVTGQPGQNPLLQNQGEAEQELVGGTSIQNTPAGPVPTSPNFPMLRAI